MSEAVTQPAALPPERAGQAAPEDLLARRAMMRGAPSRFPPVEGLKVEEARFGGVRCLRISLGARPRATVLHLHGGGFRMGAPEATVGFGSLLAARTGVQIIAPAYRLAPEHPYPAGLSDALAALEGLGAEELSRLVIAGDSAGGGLAAGLMRLALSRGIRPLGLMLYSPWIDLTVTAASYQDNAESEKLFPRDSAVTASALYLQGWPASDPLASPLFGDVAGFPPTLISVSEHEVLRDDAVSYAAALQAAGCDVTLVRTPDMEHTAPTRDPALLGAAEGAAAAVAFLERILPARA